MNTWHLAELNISRLLQPLDHPETADFLEGIAPINELAESAPGFVWRLKDEDGASSSFVNIPGVDDPNVVVNYSIWEDLETLFEFVMKSGHVDFFRRRRDWMEKNVEAATVCWWIPAGTVPSLAEAMDHLESLRQNGPSDDGWPMQERRQPPQATAPPTPTRVIES